MATWTSQRNGNWSRDAANADSPWFGGGNPANGIPANADSVIIAVGHVVTFDVDQSGFAAGLNLLTIDGELAASTTPGTYYLKMTGNITSSVGGAGAKILRAGASAVSRYPTGCMFTIFFNNTLNRQIDCVNGLKCLFYCAKPVKEWTRAIAATGKAITAIDTAPKTTVTCPGHGFAAGAVVYLSKIGGIDRLDQMRLKVKDVVDADHFTLRYGVYGGTMYIDSTGWGVYGGGGVAYPDVGTALGAATVYTEDDLSADPEWLRAGAEVIWFAQGIARYLHSITAVGAGTLTLNPVTAAAVPSGSFVALMTRNIRLYHTTSTQASNGTAGTVQNGGPHVLDCEIKGTNATATGERAVYNAPFTFTCGAHYYTNGGWSSCNPITQSGGISGWHYGYNHNVSGCHLFMSGGLQAPNVQTFNGCRIDQSGGIVAHSSTPWNGCRGIFSGGLIYGGSNNPASYNIGMVFSGGRIVQFAGNPFFQNFSMVLCGTEAIDSTGNGINNSSGKMTGGAVIACTNGIGQNGTLLITGGEVKDCGTALASRSAIDANGLKINWSTGNAGNLHFSIVDAYEQDARDGIVIRNFNGVAGSLRIAMNGGSAIDRTGLDPTFAIGPTWRFNPASTKLQPLRYQETIRVGATQSLEVAFSYQRDSIDWVQNPKIQIFKATQDPLDGYAALATFNCANDTNAHDGGLAWTADADDDYVVRVSMINPTGKLNLAWKITVGGGGAGNIIVVED